MTRVKIFAGSSPMHVDMCSYLYKLLSRCVLNKGLADLSGSAIGTPTVQTFACKAFNLKLAEMSQ